MKRIMPNRALLEFDLFTSTVKKYIPQKNAKIIEETNAKGGPIIATIIVLMTDIGRGRLQYLS